MEPSRIGMSNPCTVAIADTSSVINLNATGCSERIIRALPFRIAVVDVISGELALGRSRGRTDADLLQDLVTVGVADLVSLNDAAAGYFEELVVGPAALTLDDGEAATIAYAAVTGGMAILDEKRAIRIAAERFPAMSIGSTVDLFAHPAVQQALGAAALAEALFNALRNGRMRVLPQHVAWVIEVIGPDRAPFCASLPSSVRGKLPSAAAKSK